MTNKVTFSTQNVSWTSAMETYAFETIAKNIKRVNLPETTFNVKVSIINKKSKLIKVELSGAGFRAQCTGKDFYTAMNSVASKFKTLVLKRNKKFISLKRKNLVNVEESVDLDIVDELITKEKVFNLAPMSLDSAVDAFEQTDYNFFVFVDQDYSNKISIIYRRADNSLGLIRCIA